MSSELVSNDDRAWRELLPPLAARFPLIEDRVTIGGRTFEFLRPPSADALISEEDFNRDERLPYWAEIWPSAVVLSEMLSALPGKGRRLLELGTGMGLPALVATVQGFQVTATDYYTESLDLLRLNALRQGLSPPVTRLVDWRALPEDLGTFDVVVAADVLYEKPYSKLVAAAVSRCLSAEGFALVTDPQRMAAERFPAACAAQGLELIRDAPKSAAHGAVRHTVDRFTLRHTRRL
ncbi:MAG: methyltransferase domain-containing protein [Pirellulales bacterium]|nr:methyltransferase domain-containing protein [Pirellulales bacterium]